MGSRLFRFSIKRKFLSKRQKFYNTANQNNSVINRYYDSCISRVDLSSSIDLVGLKVLLLNY